jgi:CHAD domain-containing protein
VGVLARAAIARQADAMTHALDAARTGKVTGVHELRVAMRRLRAALVLFADALPRRSARSLEEELAGLGRSVGSVRDLDVLAAAVAKRGRKIDARLEPAVATILRHVRDQRTAAHKVLVTTLDAPRVPRLIRRLAMLARPGGTGDAPCWTVAADLVRPLIRDLVRVGRRVDATAAPAALHRLRIRAKRLRYALEALEPLGAEATKTLGRRLAALQGLLGDQRDAASQRAWLVDEIPAFVGDAEALVAVGAIAEALRRRADDLAHTVERTWRRVDRPKRLAATLRELERPPKDRSRKAA